MNFTQYFLGMIFVFIGLTCYMLFLSERDTKMMKYYDSTIQQTRWIINELKLLTSKVPYRCKTLPTNTMRKIESQMCQAIKDNKSWKSGNTEVQYVGDDLSIVYLHGNKIAVVDDTTMSIFDGGWQSVTTKSRLNALCDEFCISGEGVFQKDFLWYVRKFVGCINGKNVYQTQDFKSGYLFAWYIEHSN